MTLKPTLLLAAALLAPAANAAEFAIFIYETSKDIALRSDPGPAGKDYWNQYNQFAGQLVQSGAMRDGAALQPAPNKTNKLLGGYFKIEAADLAAAKAIAQKVPAVHRGGSVEVLATVPNPTMPAK